MENWVTWFDGLRMEKKIKEVFQGVFYIAWWYIWSFRNKTIFGSSPPKKAFIFYEIVSLTFYWCSSRAKKMLDWGICHQNPSLILM